MTLIGCGSNTYKTLPGATPSPFGVLINLPNNDSVVEAAGYYRMALFLTAKGTIYRLGTDRGLGGVGAPHGHVYVLGEAPLSLWTPSQIMPIRSLGYASPGLSHTAHAILSNGTVVNWAQADIANNHVPHNIARSYVQTLEEAATPQLVTMLGKPLVSDTPLKNIVQITSSRDATFAVTAEGVVHCWGFSGSLNILGNVNTNSTIYPHTKVPFPSTTGQGFIRKASSGWTHSAFLDTKGHVWTLGENTNGERGIMSYGGSYPQAQVVRDSSNGALSEVVDIACGHTFTVALRADGTVWAWGLGSFGVFGNPALLKIDRATQIPGLTNIRAIGVAKYTVYAADAAGRLFGVGQAGETDGAYLGTMDTMIAGSPCQTVVKQQNLGTATGLSSVYVHRIHSGNYNAYFGVN